MICSGTMSEQILSLKAGRQVRAGEYIIVKPDIALANDITAPVAIDLFRSRGYKKVHDSSMIAIIPDHFVPNKDIESAEQVKKVRKFAKEQKVKYFLEAGRMGIEHVVLPEEGWVGPGDLVYGADSHTCTYGGVGAFSTGVGSTDIAGLYMKGKCWLKVPEAIRVNLRGSLKGHASSKDIILKLIKILGVDGANYRVLEFTGEAVSDLPVEGRMTIANMAVEAGAKTGIFPSDTRCMKYVEERGRRGMKLKPSEDASYVKEVVINLDELEPQVAYPDLPSRCHNVSDAEKEEIKIDQVVIGSCTNGRISDLKVAAEMLKGKQVNENIRCIVIPGSQKVYMEAIQKGYIEIFIQSGCVVSTPTCGPCLGGYMGILAGGETALATTNRNFRGRMGHPDSRIYLASPATAAASAVTGKITAPFNSEEL